MTDSADKSIFAGKAFTGFSNTEEEQVGKVNDIPFLLEDAITKQGGIYEKAAKPWAVSISVFKLVNRVNNQISTVSCRRVR